MRDFADEIYALYSEQDPQATCRNITFQVTDDCCLKCTYCYQIHKGHRMMTNETAKKIVDLLFNLYDKNEEGAVVNRHTYGIILDFIGGEPFMNVAVMDFIMDYFIKECVRREHIWLTNFRASISTNGLLYFEPEVQKFLKKYKNFISMNVTIDGPKEIHDICRVDYNNQGSFDRSMAAWEDWQKMVGQEQVETKITIAPENLPYLNSIFDFFFKRGCTYIHANPIFEHEWTVEEGRDYYYILIDLANRLLKEDKAKSRLFDERCFRPLLSTDTENFCGGTGKMVAFDPEGLAYPCLRYMESSLGTEREPIVVGDTTGIYSTDKAKAIYEDMCKVTRQSQSTEECIDCPIATGCAFCSAWNYQETGSYNKRSTHTCWMHRAASLANVYYWNTYYLNHGSNKRFPLYLPRTIAKQLVPDEVYDSLLLLSQTEVYD